MEKPVSCNNPVCRTTAEHYTWGEQCDGWSLLNSPSLAVIEERMAPGTAEGLHRHRQAQQFFYILSGEAVMFYKDRNFVLKSGDGLSIAPGIPHQIRNDSATSLVFLVISQPAINKDREELTL